MGLGVPVNARFRPWRATVDVAAADASKTIQAAPGANLALVVTKLVITIKTAAAQVITFGDNSGTVKVAEYGASLPVGVYTVECETQLTTNELFKYSGALAGVACHVYAEGYVEALTTGALT